MCELILTKRFASVELDMCPGTYALSEPHLIVSLYLCSSKSNTWARLRSIEGKGAVSALNKPPNKEVIHFSLICPPPPGNVMIFYPSGNFLPQRPSIHFLLPPRIFRKHLENRKILALVKFAFTWMKIHLIVSISVPIGVGNNLLAILHFPLQ